MVRLSIVLMTLSLLLVGTLLAADPPATVPASQPAPPKVLLLQLVRSTGDDRELQQLALRDSSSDALAPGIKLVLEIPLPPDVVGTPTAASVASFTDDKGTYLGLGARNDRDRFGRDEKPLALTADRSKCVLKLYADRLPAADATELRLKAKISLRVGRGEVQLTQKALSLRLGKKFEAGDLKLTISSLAEPDSRNRDPVPENGLVVHFNSESSLEALKSIRFSNPDGTPIPFTPYDRRAYYDDSNSPGAGGTLAQRVPVVAMQVTCYQKVETADIPIDLTIKLGL